jgi:hypothetical protein
MKIKNPTRQKPLLGGPSFYISWRQNFGIESARAEHKQAQNFSFQFLQIIFIE